MNKSMVVAPQSEAADVALNVLEDGGNAFDAAIAGACAQGVADPHRCGLGGFGAAMLFSAAEQKVLNLTFFGRAGSKARPDIWQSISKGPAPDGFGYILEGKLNDVGYQSITVPGMVAGLEAIHNRFGSKPWKELLLRAASLARRGCIAGPNLAAFWRRPGLFGRVSTRDRLALTPDGKKIWLPGGEPPFAGDRVKQDLLAASYERLAEKGARDFYEGSMAGQIASDFEKNGALITKEDLNSYRVSWESPVKKTFFGREVFSTPLPGGGIALFQSLAAAEMEGLLSMKHNSPGYVDLLARIFSAVQADRTGFQADPEFVDLDPYSFLKEEYLRKILRPGNRIGSGESPDTTQFGVVDKDGNGIILSHSLGYGSGVFTDGLGFMYNNCMSGFDPVPGNPNSICPGKARSTAIAQTVVMDRDKKIRLLLGSPGGSHITAAITQVLINYFHLGLDLQDAVCRPRFDAYCRTLLLESRMPFDLEDDLESRWEIKRNPTPFGIVGRVYGIAITGDGLKPAYDPGEPGTARET